ncbi:MAG: glycine-rich domain-containing protein [Methylobacter sp.]
MSLYILVTGAVLLSVIYLAIRANKARQLKYIEQYHFHNGIRRKLAQKHPQLTEPQLDMVFQGLKDYFRICHQAKNRMVSMPSLVVDDAWHEFILSTRIYKKFCSKAMGRFLHHTPAEAMPAPTLAKAGIKRAWRLACVLEQINPKKPVRLPLIFAMDALLNINNGFIYQLDCKNNGAGGYCASHIGCSSGCGGSGDLFDSENSSDSSGCGSDCGGGCGGGD